MFSKHRLETLTYMVLWGLLFIAPLLSLSVRMANDSSQSFDWDEVLTVWREYGIFFALFLVHNHLLAPLLVHKQRKTLYFSAVTALVLLFAVYQCSTGPEGGWHGNPRHELPEGHRPPGFDGHRPPDFEDFEDFEKHRPPIGMKKPDRKPDGMPPAMIFSPHDLTTVIILVLMLGMNLGVKLYFKQRRDQQQMAKLENQNLQQQLEYLKYQINPHFLMNTLNNIHALVDIDPERAKDTILELSKILRFVLYEGNKPTVPLDREMAFLEDYIRLMRMRYSEDKVKVTYNQHPSVTKIQSEVPPLMFITFVENAFKHGISYRQTSFIDIRIRAEDNKLVFTCRNSKIPREEDKHGGVGLQNIKQRLELIYGNNYTLNIDEQTDTYNITLILPL